MSDSRVDRTLVLSFWSILFTGLVYGCQITPTPILPQPVNPQPTLPSPATDEKCALPDVLLFLDESDQLMQEFEDLVILAEAAPSEDLLPIIKDMEALEKSTADIDCPPCALKAQAALKQYFAYLTQGYFRLYAEALGVTPQASCTAVDEFNSAIEQLSNFNRLRKDLNESVRPE